MNIASLCRRAAVAIDADTPLEEAALLMFDEHVGALLVVTGDNPPKVVGVVTDRDIVVDAVARRPALGDGLRIGHLAKSPPLAVQGTAGVHEAAAAMEQAGVRRLLVVDDDGGVIGVVSLDDLLVAVAEDLRLLASALRKGLAHEHQERATAPPPKAQRPVYPYFGTAAAH
ncbi:MAG TPA: CBS domain-containing protein [Hydrogenophaga sp.]|uniref:CBS domain-containing protein n=1 Tax=Hydrogenophaga sp. TaxID=1904254 RepID=UPI002C5964E8|nr:CBS domain-containing protein [Hydrogenophaga sp.]HSX92496.1 CBS domain-containing protein [Hydrogenophaga sp.]